MFRNNWCWLCSYHVKYEFSKCLTLLYCSQFYATICQSESTEGLGLGPGSPLVTSLKQRVVSLASNVGVINTVQLAAQNALQSGWSILLPTAEERARTLSTLLSNEGTTLGRALGP